MLIGDKNALFIASRVLAYGKEYTYEIDDISSDNTTFGHRFNCKNKLIINSNEDYIKN